MEQIKDFLQQHKFDIFYISGIILIFTICSVFSWGYFGNLFYDNGREAYLPQLILQGKVLYKDIFAMYNPLSYEINALLYAVFGQSLNILYLAGTINALFITIGLYFISGLFINRFYSFIFCITIASIYIFGPITCTNYIFPYAYAFPYALCGFIYYCLFSLLYLKSEKRIFILSAALSLGFSFACKPEFLLCIIPFLGLLIYKKESIKQILLNFTVFLLPLIISWGILFFPGLEFKDLQKYIEFIYEFFNTREQQLFMSNTAFGWNIDNIKSIITDFVKTVLYLITAGAYFKLFTKQKSGIAGIILAPLFIILTAYLVINNVTESSNPFSWTAIAALIIMILCIKKYPKSIHQTFVQMLIFLAVNAIFSSIRLNLLLLQFAHSIYLSLIPLLVCWVYFIYTDNKFLEQYNLKRFIAAALVFLSIINFTILFNAKHRIYAELETNKGNISTVKTHVKVFQNTINWIFTNTKTDNTVVMLPEGPMINFLTGRKTNNLYYHLIPNHIAALGEDNIIKDFSKNKPDYFLINNSDYSIYGSSEMCEDFGLKICNFIKENYQSIEKFEAGTNKKDYIYIEIYKLKKDRP